MGTYVGCYKMTEFMRRWRSGVPRTKAWREAQLVGALKRIFQPLPLGGLHADRAMEVKLITPSLHYSTTPPLHPPPLRCSRLCGPQRAPRRILLADRPERQIGCGQRPGNALAVQYSVRDFVLHLRALLLFENVAAGQLAARFWPA